MFLGKGYPNEGLFKLNIMVVGIINKNVVFVYLLKSSDLWHARLNHVNYKVVRKLVTLEVLPYFKCDDSKFKIFVEREFVKHNYNFVERI